MIAADLRRPLAFGITGVIVGIVAGAWSPPGPLLFVLTTTLIVAFNALLFLRATRTPPQERGTDQELR